MRQRLVAILSIVTLIAAQTPVANAQEAAGSPAASQAAPAVAAHTIVVPAGTAIALTLVDSIKSKSTKRGDTVRAMIAFPITVGSQVAIPAGSYVEGVVNELTVRAKDTHLPAVQIHFTRLLFANGYTVPLDANNTEAVTVPPRTFSPAATQTAVETMAAPPAQGSFALAAQQTTQPTAPQVGPPMGVVIGAMLGVFAAFTIAMFAWMHHRQTNVNYVLFDAGWQFQMVLSSPLTLDAAQVAAAASAPSAQ
ncbi:MAG: hypothetical protein KGL37_08825 [Acidobacteriota bacterium]|nr:hypothetical protein [Acidobacteriota bacterium]